MTEIIIGQLDSPLALSIHLKMTFSKCLTALKWRFSTVYNFNITHCNSNSAILTEGMKNFFVTFIN